MRNVNNLIFIDIKLTFEYTLTQTQTHACQLGHGMQGTIWPLSDRFWVKTWQQTTDHLPADIMRRCDQVLGRGKNS